MADKKELRALAGEAAAYRIELERAEAKWKDLNREIKENKNLIGAAKAKIEGQLTSLEKQYTSQKQLKDAIKSAAEEQKLYLKQLRDIEKQEAKATAQKIADEEKIAKLQQKNAEELRNRVQNLTDDNSEYLDLQYDISKAFGKTSDQAKMLQAALEKTKTISGEFASLIEGSTEFTNEEKEALLEVAETYANVNKSIIQAAAENKKGIITAKQYARSVSESQGEWDKVEQKVADILEKSGKLKEITDEMSGDVKETGKGAKASVTKQQKWDLGGAVAGAAAPESTTGGLIDAVVETGAGIATAETGVGAIVGIMGAIKIAGKMGELINKLNPRPVLEVKRAFEGIDKTLENQIDQLRQYSQLQAGIPQLKAELNFAETMAKNTAAFNAASKTAFFGSALGSPKYAADQLQLAGIGADDIVSAMTELSKTAGSGMKNLGEDVAVFSKKTGIGAGEIGSIINTIRIFDKTGGGQAFSTMESSLSKSAKEGYNLADITNQLANSAELAAEFNMGSYKNILKQVEATRLLGMDMDKVAKAGQSMVLNYKDSIKAEMTLGAILGENVDLSQVRALFAAGRVSEAAALLKSSGLAAKAQGAGLFAVEALKQATGGLDITQMNAARYQLTPGAGIQSNAAFLEAFKQAQFQLETDNLVIGAQYALLTTQQVGMAEISAEFYSAISEGITGLLAKQEQTRFIGEVQAGFKAKANTLSLGNMGPEGQIGNFNYGQYGFTVTKDMIGGGLNPFAKLPGQIKQQGYYMPGAFINQPTPVQQPTVVGEYETKKAELAALELEKKNKYGSLGVVEKRNLDKKIENLRAEIFTLSKSGSTTATLTTKTAADDKTLKVNQNSYKALQTIDTSTSATTALLKNIEILQGMMVNLTNPEFKLILDGKDITKAVTQRVVNQTGTTKDPSLRVRGFQ
jgi:hypothetical protein